MSAQEKEIISKLYKIAQKQQKAIEHLVAQAQTADMNVDYLKRAVPLAAMNAGASGVSVHVEAQADGYLVKLLNVTEDNALKQKIIDAFDKMIMVQRPDLDGKVTILF